MNYKVAILPILICLLSSCGFNQRNSKHTQVSTSFAPESSDPIDSVIHFRYEQPVNGFIVNVEVTPEEIGDEGPAVITFSKGGKSFSVLVKFFITESYHGNYISHNSEEIILGYTPKPEGEMLFSDEAFFFSDIDYDGEDELVIMDWGGGLHGVIGFRVFEQDGTLRNDPPFSNIDEFTTFNPNDKTITLFYVEDLETERSKAIVYQRNKDGSFSRISG